jgi:hypothetical protein
VTLLAVALWSVLVAAPANTRRLPTALPAKGFEPQERHDEPSIPRERAGELRRDALSRAKLWRDPPPFSRIALRDNPRGPGAFPSGAPAVCKFHFDKASGATPKFKCVFAGGEILKVKYGHNPEIQTEVAASRLLETLGAGTDRVYLLETLRCFGCPEDPDALIRCVSSPYEDFRRRCGIEFGRESDEGEVKVTIDYGKFVDFHNVSVERRFSGREIVDERGEGWGFDELDAVASAKGATRAERDALRLLAVILDNWDNRRDNQRLVCLPGGSRRDGRCLRPFAYMQDVGGTFGRVGGSKDERKLDVEGWSEVRVWKDEAACVVEIESPPFHGATFGEATISESGRRFLLERLRRIPEDAVRDLFAGAGFAEYEWASPASRNVDNWVRAFQEKVRQIADRAPCPTP